MGDARVSTAAPIRHAGLGVPHAFLTGEETANERFDLCTPGAQPVFVKQVHSARVVQVEAPFPEGERPEVDALVTDRPGLILAIVTADCVPVLLADPQAGVIGAAHAGWRGAVAGVAEATVREMERLGADRGRVQAAIGPSIRQQSYEVDAPLREKFASSGDERFFAPGRPGHWQFDLPGYVAERLTRKLDIASCAIVGPDTYSDEAFHSYRRATHRGEPSGGRQFSLIALP